MDINSLTQFSFYFGTAAMLCSAVFFFFERGEVAPKWRTSVTVAGLVTFIAFFHYYFMRDAWGSALASGDLTQLRYIDWLITVPLQIVEFYLILKVVGKVTSGLFWQLLIASIVMLVGGLLGEMGTINEVVGFVIGMIGWLYVVYLIFAGGAAKASSESGNQAVQSAFNSMKLIVLVGWAIYPIGYIIGNMIDVTNGTQTMNIIYNFADLINKTAFGLVIWAAAKQDSK
ncbi:MAG: bacteriorhodopsin-like [Dehalococcoidia bacterium]|jgi:bacteriorhodopsin|nr:biphenyl 2,3-dioxygenase [Rickettsiales bacterium]MCH2494923.1 bacteriorhodopsin-like [Dehalococcoidia bacterium]MEC7920150.1 bacteriorhodopsin-like [Chloroflexota bacterium]MQF84218.1 biphenyl 2,3-dioxygenase [SAR202 cluster bacterium]MEC9098723.1 bacteriorhodopsin-like [Chloroflexota bacterium]|tara:strand:+ start:3325 stop:4011 length:687 start_codon:yes stop_codon:yes gene_type:complete